MEILILDGQQIELPQKRVSQTYQINDLAEVQDRQLSYTNRFTAKLTPNNVKAMDYLGAIGNKSRKPYKRIPAKFIVDGLELMPNGYANVRKTNDPKGYEINIYDGNASLYETLKGRRMNQLNYQDINHFLNLTTYEESFVNTEGYIYGIGDFGHSGVSSVINIERQAASLYRHTLIKKILFEAGFTWSGDIFEDPNFLTEVVTPTKGYTIDQTGETQTPIGSANTNTLNRNEFSQDQEPLFFEDIFTLTGSGLTNLTKGTDVEGDYIQADFNGTLNVSIDISHTLTDGAAAISIRKNGSNIVYQLLQTGYNLNREYTIIVNSGDLLRFYLSSSSFDIQTPEEPFQLLNVSASLVASFEEITGGVFIDFANIMPESSQIDFVKSWMQDYGLMFQTNRKPNDYEFITMESLLNDRENAEIWTDKLRTKGDEEYKIGSYAQENFMKYKYPEDILEATHDGKLEVDNENISSERTLFSSIFTISSQSTTKNGEPIYLIPLWEYKDPDILNKESEFRKFRINRVDTTINVSMINISGSVAIVDNIPFLSLINISFEFYKAIYYTAFNKVLDNPLKRTPYIFLRPIDIYNIDFFKLKYFKQFGEYFYLNKVSNFINGKYVKCELIQSIGITINQPPNQLGDRAFNISHEATKVIPLSYFTDTTPPYSDPEFDQPEKIKILNGFNSDVLLKNNGILINVVTEIMVSTMALTLEDQGNITAEHLAQYEFEIKSFNSDEFSTVTGNLIATILEKNNSEPIADAGGDVGLAYNSEESGDGQVNLNGSASSDPNNDPITYLWTLNSPPNGITLQNVTSATATVVGTNLPFFYDGLSFDATLRVTDNGGLFDEDTITITLNDLNPNPL